jgi:hypothetical protein
LPSTRFDKRAASPAALVAALCIATFEFPAGASAQSLYPYPSSSPFIGPTQPQPSSPPATEPAPNLPEAFGIIGLRRAEAVAGRSAAAAPSGAVTNFGRPRKRLKFPRAYPQPRQSYPAPFSPQNPLPPLEPYRSSAQAKALRRLKAEELALRPPNPPDPPFAVLPTFPIRQRPRVDDRLYDALGIGIGSMRIRPFLEASYGYDDNPNRLVVDPRGSRYVRGDVGLHLSSE